MQEIYPFVDLGLFGVPRTKKRAPEFDLSRKLALAPSESPSDFAAGAVLRVGAVWDIRANCLQHEHTLYTGCAATNRLICASRGTQIENRLLLVPQYNTPNSTPENGYSLLIILNVQHLRLQK